jgi:hypothetical protein
MSEALTKALANFNAQSGVMYRVASEIKAESVAALEQPKQIKLGELGMGEQVFSLDLDKAERYICGTGVVGDNLTTYDFCAAHASCRFNKTCPTADITRGRLEILRQLEENPAERTYLGEARR